VGFSIGKEGEEGKERKENDERTIEQFIRQLSDLERRLRDSCCLYAAAQDILVCGEVRG